MAEVRRYAAVDALPAAAATLFARAPFQSGAAWWRCVEAAALPAGGTPQYWFCHEAGRPLALLPLLAAPGALTALTTQYTVTWAPLLAAGADAAALARAGAALGRALRSWPAMRLDAIDPEAPGLAPLLAGLRRAGWLAARYAHFGNWGETLAGRDWAAYLAARPGALRETIRRKGAKAARDPRLQLDCLTAPEAVEAGIAAYRAVYARSWKVPEPCPAFDAALLRAAAVLGALRLGLLRCDGEAIAAQYWIVWQGSAAVLKLAHDEARRAHSPGTVLTAWMIRRLLDEGVTDLDFGRGDDPYKQLWCSERRQRIGLVLARPTHPAGLLALGRQWGGAAWRHWRAAARGIV